MALQVAPIDPNEFAAVNALAHQNYAAQQPQPAAAGGHQRNILQTLLPAIGATGLGLAAAPFTGGLSLLPTLALIGGASAVGGAGGEFLAQRSNNEKQDLGSILKEGAVSGALGAGGEAFNALRGAKAASGIAEAAQGAQPAKVGIVEALGRGLKTGASGYGVGAKVAGEQQLTTAGSDAIENTLKALKVPATAPERQASILRTRISNIEDNLNKMYTNANTSLQPQELSTLKSAVLQRVGSTAGLSSKAAQQYAEGELGTLAKSGDLVGLRKYVTDLARSGTNYAASGSAKLADREQVNRIIIDEARNFLNGRIPGLADANSLYHSARTAENFILNAARDKGGSLINRLASSTPVKMAEAKAGSLIENVGKATTKAGTVAAPLALQTIPRAMGGDYQLNNQANIDSTMQMAPPMTTAQTATPTNAANIDLPYQTSGNVSSSPFDPANIEASIGQIAANGGTLDDITKFLSIASTLQSLQGAGQKPLNATQQTQANNAVSALSDLGTLASAIQSDPNIALKDAIPGGSVARGLTGTTDYDTAKQNIVDVIARLRSGAAITQDEANRYMSMLPAPGDSSQSALNKLSRLQSLLSAFANPQPAPTSSDLISALGGAQ